MFVFIARCLNAFSLRAVFGVFLSLVFSTSHCAQILACLDVGLASGATSSHCSNLAWMESSFLGDNALILTCDMAVYPDGCEWSGESGVLKKFPEFTETDALFLAGGWVNAMSGNWGIGGGIGGGGSGSSSSSSPSGNQSNLLGIPDLSWSQWGEIMTAIGGLFVTMGVIGFIRKKV